MKKIIIFLIALFVLMESIGLYFYQNSKKKDMAIENQTENISKTNSSEPTKTPSRKGEENKIIEQTYDTADDNLVFPPPSVETVNGKKQRTIHIGARKWQWDPSVIEANVGEKVILIMHNADIVHSFSIPDLNVRDVVPEEGAVITFELDKQGTFEFSCDVSNHTKMQGKIVVNQ